MVELNMDNIKDALDRMGPRVPRLLGINCSHEDFDKVVSLGIIDIWIEVSNFIPQGIAVLRYVPYADAGEVRVIHLREE